MQQIISTHSSLSHVSSLDFLIYRLESVTPYFCCLTEQNKSDPNLLLDKVSRLTDPPVPHFKCQQFLDFFPSKDQNYSIKFCIEKSCAMKPVPHSDLTIL